MTTLSAPIEVWPLDADPAAGRRVAGDHDIVARDAELARERDPAPDVEDDRPACGGGVVEAVAERADRSVVGELGDVIDIAAAAAAGVLAVALGLREGLELRKRRRAARHEGERRENEPDGAPRAG